MPTQVPTHATPPPPLPPQLVIVLSNVYWCAEVEECFALQVPTAALAAFLAKNVAALRDLIKLVRGQLSPLLRKVRPLWGRLLW